MLRLCEDRLLSLSILVDREDFCSYGILCLQRGASHFHVVRVADTVVFLVGHWSRMEYFFPLLRARTNAMRTGAMRTLYHFILFIFAEHKTL